MLEHTVLKSPGEQEESVVWSLPSSSPSPGAQAHWEPDPHMSPVLHLPFQKPWGVGIRAKFAI